MTAAAEPVPTLELPSAALMQWSQLALLLAAQLAARRERLDRLAWSDGEHAARAHDLAERREAIEPAVRAMTTDEIAYWSTSTSDPTPETTTGPVSAEIAPINDRWALHATAHHDDTTVGHVWVSCRDEALARDMAREIVASGQPETVYRLGAHVALAEQADAHRAQVQASTPPTDRAAMAAHVQSAWPEVAAAVLGCPAWPTLADKLAAAQHHGHDLPALLGRLNTSGIPTARKPAALAARLLDQATGRSAQQQSWPREQLNAAAHPYREQLLSWVDRLDPASSIDRVGALGALGHYGAGVDARLLSHFPDLLDDAAHRAGQVATETLAGDRERSAAAHQATPDDPTTLRREDLEGQDLAHRDRHEAAAARALAAEHHAAPHAAVARASVTLTPPTATTSQPAARPVTPQAPSVQPSAPIRTPRRTR